jgi:predicted HTH transcriptional regulator
MDFEDTINSLSVNEIKIIGEIENNPKVTAEKLSEILKINVRNIKNNIARLKDKNRIERKGSNISGYWKINE